jgi:hypothetical protein
MNPPQQAKVSIAMRGDPDVTALSREGRSRNVPCANFKNSFVIAFENHHSQMHSWDDDLTDHVTAAGAANAGPKRRFRRVRRAVCNYAIELPPRLKLGFIGFVLQPKVIAQECRAPN